MFGIRKRIKPTGKIINMWQHKSWGNSIIWSDFEKRRIVGWMPSKPVVGDEIRCRMSSGKTARFLVKDVEYAFDPRDMFFANLEDYKGYVEDTEDAKKTQEP